MARQQLILTILAVAALTALTADVWAQDVGGFGDFGTPAGPANHANATLYSRVAEGKVRAVIEIKVEEGWHLYHDVLGHPKAMGKPLKVTMGGKGITWTKVRLPKPHKLDQSDVEPDTWIYSHEGTILLYAEGTLAEGAAGDDVAARLEGQTCSDTSCVDYKQSVTSAGAGADDLFAAFPAGLVDYTNTEFVAEPAVDRSLWVWLAIAFLAGTLMNVTPCVLPLISIKVLGFVQQAGESHRRMFALGTAFAGGMLLVYWALAAAASVLKLGWGEQFQSATFSVIMIALVFAFGLSLMGVFTLGVPKKITQLDAGLERQGVGDALFTGMLATLLATPCAGPFMGTMLAWSLGESNLTIFAVFTLLGLGMGLPYMILTTFPKLLDFLPKPGPWMETFKKVMGFVLMAMVIFLMVSLREDLLLFTNTLLVFVAVGCWVWGHFVRFDQPRGRRLGVLAASLGIVAIGAWFSFGPMLGAYGTPVSAGQVEQTRAEDIPRGHVTRDRIVWEKFSKARFNEYLASGRTVFLDFTADWCKNCGYNERFVFETDTVRKALIAKDAVPMKADLSHEGPRTEMLTDLRGRLGGRALPYLVIFPGGRPRNPIRLRDLLSVDSVVEALKACPDPPKGEPTASTQPQPQPKE